MSWGGGGSEAEVYGVVKYLYLHSHFCIVYGRFAKVLFASVRFAYVLGQFPNCFCLISGLKNEVYTCVSHFFASWLREGSFRCLAERDKTLAKRPVTIWCRAFSILYLQISDLGGPFS